MSVPLSLVLTLSFTASVPAAPRPPERAVPPAASEAALDAGDDEYNFLVGLAEKGLSEQVVREALRFLERHGKHAKKDLARYRLATALFDLDRAEEARPHLEQLARLSRFEFEDEVRFRLGQCQLERGAFGEAVEAFEAVRRGGADYLRVPATFLLAEARFRGDDFEGAEPHYRAVIEAEDAAGYASDAARGFAWCAFRRGKHEDCVARARRALKEPGEHAGELHFLAAESLYELGRHDDAREHYGRVKEGEFQDAALRGLGFVAAARGDHAEAAREFGRLLERFPQSRYAGEARLHRGIHLLKSGDGEAARTALREAAEGGAEGGFWLGRAQLEAGDAKGALEAFDRALRANPSEELAGRIHVARGDALFALGREDEAAAAYQKAGSDYALHSAAVAKLNAGEPAEALRLARAIAEREGPYRVDAALVVGEALFQQEEYGPAEAAFAVVARDGETEERSRARARVGWCRYLAGDHAAASEAFADVVADFPRSKEAEEASFMSARAAEAAEDPERARRGYRRYLERFPEGANRVEATFRLARFEGGKDAERRYLAVIRDGGEAALATSAHYELAELQAADGRFEEALPHYRAVLEQGASDVRANAHYGLAWCLYSTGDARGAARELDLLTRSTELDETLRQASLELSVWACRKAGDAGGTRAAFERFRAACTDGARRLRAAKVAAAALKEAGDLSGAAKLYDDLLSDTKDRDVAVEVCVERGYLALDQQEIEQAEKLAKTALKYAEDKGELLELCFFVGEARFEAGEDARAAELYALAQGSPDERTRERALYKGGFCNLRAGENEAAAKAFAKLVDEHSRSELFGEGLFLLGEAHYRAGAFGKAAEALARHRRDARKHDTAPKALFRLGLARAKLEEWGACAEALSELATRFPEFTNAAEAELWRGRANARQEKRRAARQSLERVLELDRGILSAQARIELGRLKEAEGALDDALSQFLKVAVLYAHEEEVAEALVRAGGVLEAQGEPEQAKKQYQEVIEKHPRARFAEQAKERLAAL